MSDTIVGLPVLTAEQALSQIILCRKPLDKIAALATVIVNERGNASEKHGLNFGLWPLWAAQDAEAMILTAMLVHLESAAQWYPFTDHMVIADVEALLARFNKLQKAIKERGK